MRTLSGADTSSAETPSRPTNGRSGIAFRAEPNPIRVCDGSRFGRTTITWHAHDPVDVRVGDIKGKLFARGLARGRADTGLWVTDGMQFLLIDAVSGELLDLTVVRLTAEGCDLD
ncbi:MAG: hypothetical protein MPN21_12160 [Thermoanaerobaculia bacterium]|nr:hypothetical protein [Thermoanaerobaculia bacterium]